ncbi:MAG TPA: PAC2 family protein [Phycisphaerae bacterium]|nr:PAC2 family protein [Phycisphaerae bacterium]
MPIEALNMAEGVERMEGATLLVALTGWMDGGDVSTGTVKRLMENRTLVEVARIDADPFYIFNFPGSMEVAAVFRPEVRMKKGLIRRGPKIPENVFHADAGEKLVFFLGAEPNLRWQSFADAIFELCERIGVKRIVFVGSFGGTVPHTREPRLYGSISHAHLADILTTHNLRASDYSGPSSFSTLLVSQCPAHGIEMVSFVAEIPGYLNGENPLSIEAVSRRLAKFLNLPIDLASMREASNAWEAQVSEAVQKDEELAQTVRKLEEAYDNELIGQPGEGE